MSPSDEGRTTRMALHRRGAARSGAGCACTVTKRGSRHAADAARRPGRHVAMRRVAPAARIPAKPRRMRTCRASAAMIPWNATPGAAVRRAMKRRGAVRCGPSMTMMQDAPVLVTGCAGFIGMHTALALLALGRRVTGVDNLDPYYDVALEGGAARAARSQPGIPVRRGSISRTPMPPPRCFATARSGRSCTWRRSRAFVIRSSIPERTSPTI